MIRVGLEEKREVDRIDADEAVIGAQLAIGADGHEMIPGADGRERNNCPLALGGDLRSIHVDGRALVGRLDDKGRVRRGRAGGQGHRSPVPDGAVAAHLFAPESGVKGADLLLLPGRVRERLVRPALFVVDIGV